MKRVKNEQQNTSKTNSETHQKRTTPLFH